MVGWYVNKSAQENGDHEVHSEECRYRPSDENAEYVGDHDTCEEAVSLAKQFWYKNSDGCKFCAPSCHKS